MTVVAPSGELDLDAAPALRRSITGAVLRGTDVLLDLSAVSLFDCACLGAVLAANRTAVAVGRTVTLMAPQPLVRRCLDLTGAATVLPVIDHRPGEGVGDRQPVAVGSRERTVPPAQVALVVADIDR
ncbi:STAS domain-containing protein [Jidongwangia harbinensis]|uniref:STAS domain-containing protein n=1 Tax=Jidongwangia harbinensis TaxID=2878561 RepID=UPI0027DF1717|nr:STAS domain-containing protein [Jidongwangia harbinensis]